MGTWPCVDGFGLPVGICEVIGLPLLQRLDRLVLVYKRVAALTVAYEARDDASNCIRTFSSPTSSAYDVLQVNTRSCAPQILADGIGYFVKQDAGRINDAQTPYDRHVLCQDILSIGSGVQQAFLVPVRFVSMTIGGSPST